MAELAYCVPRAIRHSAFLSWPVLDQDKALAYMEIQASACPDCGIRPDEIEDDPEAFIADSRRCVTCEQLETKWAAIPEEANLKGVKFFLRRNPIRRWLRME